MVTDEQVKRLRKLNHNNTTQEIAAAKSGMSVKTARKYIQSDLLPSEMKQPRYWRTRENPFESHWMEITGLLETHPRLQATTIFKYLQREYPGVYQDGQLRTLQEHIRVWRATEGPPKEVFFPQKHFPGKICQTDFTCMNALNITIAGQPYPHLLYHFVLTYSNWESVSICFSESFESLSQGLQQALFNLGGVPEIHQTDQLSAALKHIIQGNEFTPRYKALLNHYGLEGRKIEVAKPNQNGDIEQRHNRFKQALDQDLMLRGYRDFESVKDYNCYLQTLVKQLNAAREKRFREEQTALKSLPAQRLDLYQTTKAKVRPSSTIRILRNTYSVHSQLIGEEVDLRIKADQIELWYRGRHQETFPRLKGRDHFRIDYRHIIAWLIRKPGAFENYLYKEDLFPNSHFRMAYDSLRKSNPIRATKEYLKLLQLAADLGEVKVLTALTHLLNQEASLNVALIESMLRAKTPLPSLIQVEIKATNLKQYDVLLKNWEVAL